MNGIFINSFDGTKLYVVKEIPENPKIIVVLVHGVAEHLGRYQYLKEKLNSFGYGVYRFDIRGHGKSEGERGDLNDFNDYIEDASVIVKLAKKNNPSVPIIMLGHSMGGFITAAYGVKYPDTLNGQILSGAATNKLPLSLKLKSIKFSYIIKGKVPNSLSKLLSKDASVVKKYEDDPLVLKQTTYRLNHQFVDIGIPWLLRNISTYKYPCLILHGGSDGIVPKYCSEKFYENIASKDKKLIIYEGCYHEIFNEDEKDKVISDIHDWIEKLIER